ncbi:MAG: 16S rRNA (cytidine(1402)-2'-O)-methyltransferase [Acholeplasmataceae bacterium]|nr:16S rRNA (cytidine(1402)-2'-O)-methyltransferase [Acholeplasmataceae bacterium]
MQSSFKDERPTLFIVSTPIGNLKDITLRALETLQHVDVIFAEDTRTSGVLLKHYDINKPVFSYHEFNKTEKELHVLTLLEERKNIALISDAGTPGISDPGFEIIQKVIEAGFHVVAIPGASAMLTALVSSGLVMQPFTFIGFLPRKLSSCTELIDAYRKHRETLIIYESPTRIKKTLECIYQAYGNRKIVISRELTKIYETIVRTTLEASLLMEHNPKGEYVLLIEGNREIESFDHMTIEAHMRVYLQQGYTEKDAMKHVAKDRNVSKSVIYQAYKIDEK